MRLKMQAIEATPLVDLPDATDMAHAVDTAMPALRAVRRWPLPVWLSVAVPALSMVLALMLATAVDGSKRSGAAQAPVNCASAPDAAAGASADSGCRHSAAAGARAR